VLFSGESGNERNREGGSFAGGEGRSAILGRGEVVIVFLSISTAQHAYCRRGKDHWLYFRMRRGEENNLDFVEEGGTNTGHGGQLNSKKKGQRSHPPRGGINLILRAKKRQNARKLPYSQGEEKNKNSSMVKKSESCCSIGLTPQSSGDTSKRRGRV